VANIVATDILSSSDMLRRDSKKSRNDAGVLEFRSISVFGKMKCVDVVDCRRKPAQVGFDIDFGGFCF
jgi:hypothetical protein